MLVHVRSGFRSNLSFIPKSSKGRRLDEPDISLDTGLLELVVLFVFGDKVVACVVGVFSLC